MISELEGNMNNVSCQIFVIVHIKQTNRIWSKLKILHGVFQLSYAEAILEMRITKTPGSINHKYLFFYKQKSRGQ